MEKGHHHEIISKKTFIMIHLPPKDAQLQTQEIDIKRGVLQCRPTHPSHNYKRRGCLVSFLRCNLASTAVDLEYSFEMWARPSVSTAKVNSTKIG